MGMVWVGNPILTIAHNNGFPTHTIHKLMKKVEVKHDRLIAETYGVLV
jgi:hypothetical protein